MRTPYTFALVFLLAVFVGICKGQVSFNLAPRYNLGIDTFDSVYADFDGDGVVDIALANGRTNTPTISVVYGKEGGTFEDKISVRDSSLIPHVIAAGDLNRDGRPDLVVGAFYQNRIAVFLNLGGQQFADPVVTFPPDPPFPNAAEFEDLEVADLDGDGALEVVALQDQTTKRLRFFEFGDDGTLNVVRTLSLYGGQSAYEGLITIGDINRDSITDVIVAGGQTNRRRVDFVLGGPLSAMELWGGFPILEKGTGISVADLDGDRDTDLVLALNDTTTPTEHSVRSYLNDGGGNFIQSDRKVFAYPFHPNGVTTGDFDNDGIFDIATLLESVVAVARGRGDGTFSGDDLYAVGHSNAIVAMDHDHDGRIDILVNTYQLTDFNSLSTFMNVGAGRFSAPPTVLWSPPLQDFADIDGDRHIDILSSWQTLFSSPSTFEILKSDRQEGFLDAASFDTPPAVSSIKGGDFNGDGRADVIVSQWYSTLGFSVFLNTGNGSVSQQPVTTQVGESIAKAYVVDLNNDTMDDVIGIDRDELIHVGLSQGEGNFVPAPGSPFEPPKYIENILIGDLNNDGNADAIAVRDFGLELWLGDGTGRLTITSTPLPLIKKPVLGDLDGDGHLDLVGRSNDSIVGFLGNGNGTFGTEFAELLLGPGTSVKNIVVGKFDSDEFLDAAVLMENMRGTLAIFTYRKSRDWGPPQFFDLSAMEIWAGDYDANGSSDIGYRGTISRGIIYNVLGRRTYTLFDIDGDGKADPAVFRPDAQGVWYALGSQTGFMGGVEWGISTDKLVPADYDGDGKTDEAVYRDGVWWVLNSNGGGYTQTEWGIASDIPVPADYDGDGKADLAVYRNGVWWILYANGSGYTQTEWGLATDVPVPADYDGDGRADLAVYRDGTWWILYANGSGTISTEWGISTDLPVPADYDGDGKTDLAVYRDGTWWVINSNGGGGSWTEWGISTDIPVPADYDGDGKTDLAVYRDGDWWMLNSSGGGYSQTNWGLASDLPIPRRQN